MQNYSKKLNYFLPVIIIVIVGIVSLLRGGGQMGLDIGDDAMTVTSPDEFSFTVAFDEIGSMELVELTDPGTMLSGDENSGFSWGTWENEAWGQYSRCTCKKADQAILITTLDDAHMVFSFESDDTTASLLDALNDLLANRESGETA